MTDSSHPINQGGRLTRPPEPARVWGANGFFWSGNFAMALGGTLYLDHGWATFIAGLAQAARDAGVTLNVGARVERVEADAHGSRVVLADGRVVVGDATILAVGAGEQRVVVKNGQPAVATVMSVTLSTDHRAVDGALGAELIAAFKQLIENPMSMLV